VVNTGYNAVNLNSYRNRKWYIKSHGIREYKRRNNARKEGSGAKRILYEFSEIK
jgi:hypothetical protein